MDSLNDNAAVGKVRRLRAASAIRVARGAPAGKASLYIGHACELPPGTKVILVCRKSRRDRIRTLDLQEKNLMCIAKQRGWVVVAIVRRVLSGFYPERWLPKLAWQAKATGAALVAESTCRFLRHDCYHSEFRWDCQASDSQLWFLRYITRGVPMFTICHPDATPSEERSYQTKRGGPGRPRKPLQTEPGAKKRRRQEMFPQVRRLRENGRSIRQISGKLGIPVMTVSRWVNWN